MMTISDLLKKLVEEIVSRVPLRVLSTWKNWNTLSKSQSFAKMHTGEQGELRMAVLMDYNLSLASVFINGDQPSIKPQGKVSCLDEQVKISQVFHCEGLLLCVLEEDDTKVVVCNPYLGQTRCIESRYSHRPNRWDRFTYALGYEDKKSCRKLKFLRFIDKYYNAKEDQFFWYEIYDFDSGLWKTLELNPHWRILFGTCGVSLKGNTYLPASKRSASKSYSEDELEDLDDHIICFDFTSESFGPLLRLPFDAGVDDYVNLSCVGEEKLAVTLTHNEVNPYEIDVWIATKIEAEEVLWSKFLKVDTAPNFYMIPCTGFFIDEEKKVVMGFAEDRHKTFNILGEDGYFRKLDFGERAYRNCRPQACSYVPSLMQVKQPLASGGQSKQQSDLEKRRYDQNMSRLLALEEKRAEEEERRN
ncbi:unnamed protein product [Microthlaspi erraticum]|uniref:F-box associated beta-propeller type 1 domain-containing protein n=1 Tax=Microthlaspi erraticum TaxID=1685480 RepID=A0A6D2L353_9BRAS|nr:unnamed protein product [Microthlaspi erraticum]